MSDNRTDRPYWCEICARKKDCYGITLKPKCFVPTADRKTEPHHSGEVTEMVEPQTIAEDINRRVEMGKKEWNARHIETEPQTERSE